MPNFGTAVQATPAAASAAAYFEFRANSRRAKIYKLIVTNTQTVVSSVGLILATNTPSPTTLTTPQPYDAADAASTATLNTAWNVAPTVGSNYMYLFTLGGAVGSGLTDTWAADKPIIVAKNTSLIGWNSGSGAGGALSVSIAYDE